MADSFSRQVTYAGAKALLFAYDAFLIDKVGSSRVGSNPSVWPDEFGDLPDDFYATYRTPSSAPIGYEHKVSLDVDTPGSGVNTINFGISPLIDPGSGWTDGDADFGDNPATTDIGFTCSEAGDVRVTFVGDERRVQIWNETAQKLSYIGRFISAYDEGVDPFPVCAWAGDRALTGLTTFKRVSPLDDATVLSGGFVSIPRHPSDSDQDPLATGQGQDTEASSHDWAQYDAEIHWCDGGKFHHPGWLDRVFIMESIDTNKLWGARGEFLSRKGILHSWEANKSVLA